VVNQRINGNSFSQRRQIAHVEISPWPAL